MSSEPAVVHAPKELWRIGRGPDPLAGRRADKQTLGSSRAGNRFDSRSGNYAVLYFGSSAEVCFGETLARFRPSPALIALIGDDWNRLGHMEVGAVPADWRILRTLVKVRPPTDALFLDVEARETHQFLRTELAIGLAELGVQDLDVSVIRGPNRRVTRLISEWAYNAMRDEWEDEATGEIDGEPMFAGIRYLSRIDTTWECWAVFDDIELEVLDLQPITRDMPDLDKIVKQFGLVLH